MQLKLAIGNKVIASIPLDTKKASNIDYINAKRRLLNVSHYATIVAFNEPPVYFIEVASKMNKPSFHKVRRRAS